MIGACWHSLLLEICKPGGLLRLFIPPNSCTRSWADWDESQTEVLCKHLLRSIYFNPHSFAFTEAFDHLLAARKFGPHPHGSQLKAGNWEKEKKQFWKGGLEGWTNSAVVLVAANFSILVPFCTTQAASSDYQGQGCNALKSDPLASPIFVYLFEESHLCFVAQRSGSGLKSDLSLFLHQLRLQQVLPGCRYGDASHNGINLSKQLSLFRVVRGSSREVGDLCCAFGPDLCMKHAASAIFFGSNVNP